MSVIGKLITRSFRLPLRFSLFPNKQRAYSILGQKLNLNYQLKNRNLQSNFCVLRKHLSLVKRKTEVMGSLSPLDPSSFSRPEQAIIKHVDLVYNVDFGNKVLNGVAVLTIEVLDYIENVILDTSNLDIKSIEFKDGTPLKYKLDDPVPNYGSKLTITLPQSAAPEQKPPTMKDKLKIRQERHNDPTLIIPMTFTGFTYKPREPCYPTTDINESRDDTPLDSTTSLCMKTLLSNVPIQFYVRQNMLQIKITYATSPNATALQWLDPNQTSGKKSPYLFSQCQPIHARSILPCQDTPAVKFTYEAEVTAPEEFTVLMSAIRLDAEASKTSFNQPVPIPSYLLALAVGVLESRKLGPRSHVWSEKEEIEQSAWEFAETEKYLQAAERLCGPYQWTQYDLLVLPPSFPYGGMENPCLTFVTPTLLAGDRSQADVIVHEIMHSWTGNLVTNRNFEHFWLNEGFTVFLERKVAASLLDPRNSTLSRDFHSLLGLQELSETVNDELGPQNALTRLVVSLGAVTPDDAFSTIPYEKGSLFLRYLEDLLGGPAVFDDFMRSYLNHFQSKSLDTDQFKAYFLNYFKDNEKISQVDWDTWLYKSGMPPVIPDYDTSMTKSVNALLAKINEPNATFDYENDIKMFTPHQVINLLQALIDQEPLPLEKLRLLGKEYRLGDSKNTEIIYRWLRLCIRSKDQEKLNDALTFVNQQGRMKYVRPIYRDLYAWEDVRARAIENFLENEPFMMHVSAYTLRKDLHLSE